MFFIKLGNILVVTCILVTIATIFNFVAGALLASLMVTFVGVTNFFAPDIKVAVKTFWLEEIPDKIHALLLPVFVSILITVLYIFFIKYEFKILVEERNNN